MARVKDANVDELSSDLKALYEQFVTNYGPFSNQLKVFAHRPPAFKHLMGLLLESSEEALLPKRYLELVLVVVSRLNHCVYCVKLHEPKLMSEGFSETTVENILRPDCPGLDKVETLVRDYAILVTESANNIPDAIFTELRQTFSEAQIVELTLRIALCGFFNRFNAALEIEEETEFHSVLNSVQNF